MMDGTQEASLSPRLTSCRFHKVERTLATTFSHQPHGLQAEIFKQCHPGFAKIILLSYQTVIFERDSDLCLQFEQNCPVRPSNRYATVLQPLSYSYPAILLPYWLQLSTMKGTRLTMNPPAPRLKPVTLPTLPDEFRLEPPCLPTPHLDRRLFHHFSPFRLLQPLTMV